MLGFLKRRPPVHGRCLACGICCELYGNTLAASPRDLARWAEEQRTDLLQRVGAGGELWVDPADGERLERCPFLERRNAEASICGIHATKPDICREYPTPVHAFRCVRGIRFPGKTFTSCPPAKSRPPGSSGSGAGRS